MNPPKTPAFHDDREKTAEPIRPREFSRTTPELPAGEPARWAFLLVGVVFRRGVRLGSEHDGVETRRR